MTFAEMLISLQQGCMVRRKGWNGKGMYLFLVTDWDVQASPAFDKVVELDGDAEFAHFICMRTADQKMVPWLASQTDILATDWEQL